MDVNFYYMVTIREENFKRIQNDNNLTIEYDQFLPMLKKIIDDCEHRPHLFKISFTLDDEDGNAVVRFYHDSEMKRSELLALDNFR
jgi:hypothetical protein